MLFWHGIPYGVDFRGGTLVYVKFAQTPNDNAIRAAMDHAGLRNVRIQRFGQLSNNEVLIGVSQEETNEQALDRSKTLIINALETNAPAGKQDLNNASVLAIKTICWRKIRCGQVRTQIRRYGAQAQAIADYRDKTKGGVLTSLDELKAAADPAVVASLQDGFYLSDFAVRNVEIVGPQVGDNCAGRPCWLRSILWPGC